VRIGVSGWRLLGHTGVPRYIQNVVGHWSEEALGRACPEVTVYSPVPVDGGKVGLPRGVRVRVLRPAARMLVWENLRLGPLAGDDVVWYPSYDRPLASRARVVVTTHDATVRLYPELYPLAARTFYAHLHGWSARHAALVLTHNETTRRDIERLFGVPSDRIRVIPLAPASVFRRLGDAAAARAIGPRVLGRDVPFFLTVGKLSTRRNVPALIEGFARFKHVTREPHALVIVGQNALGVPVADLAERLRVADDVVHLPYVTDDDLVLLYNAAAAFVLAATYEANSITSLEAQACGAPACIPDTPGLREMTGDAALVVARPEPDLIASALGSLASDEGLRRRLSQEGLRHAARFTWPRTARATLEALEEAARGPACAAPATGRAPVA
jgi:glycosyltransferase involved in cell wall biosynthesis